MSNRDAHRVDVFNEFPATVNDHTVTPYFTFVLAAADLEVGKGFAVSVPSVGTIAYYHNKDRDFEFIREAGAVTAIHFGPKLEEINLSKGADYMRRVAPYGGTPDMIRIDGRSMEIFTPTPQELDYFSAGLTDRGLVAKLGPSHKRNGELLQE